MCSPKSQRMKRFTGAIDTAVRDQNWLAATALALTLPDICGRMEHGRASERRYKAWWGKYMLSHYQRADGSTSLSSGDAYALRCAYVHEGRVDILGQRAREVLTRFRFVAPNQLGLPVHNQRGPSSRSELILQVDIFCQEIIDAVNSWSSDVASNPDVQERLQSLLEIHEVYVEPIPARPLSD